MSAPTLLADLPPDHPDRSRPLEGAWTRVSIPIPVDVTDSGEKRRSILERRAAGERMWIPWKRVSGWRIGKSTYNQLGKVWTDHAEWTFSRGG